MAKLLLGREVADALAADLTFRVEQLQRSGVDPALTIIRLGEKAGDMSYEKGARNRAAQLGVRVNTLALPETTTVEELMDTIDRLNDDAKVHGVLLLRPLPEHMRDRKQEIFNHLVPEKDVDGMTDISAAGVYTGQGQGFPPCTPAACMEMLDHYGIAVTGKKALVMGRSMVVGRPAAMMLLKRDATISMVHTRTDDPHAYIPNTDILICAAGVKGLITGDMVRPGQVVLDVSMNYDPEKITARGKGGMVGDCDFAAVEPIVDAITPVPGGVGAVTNTVLMKHVIEAAEKSLEQ